MCEASDFLVSLGGDGTLLSLVRRSYGYKKPVVGINAGNLGFLADITIDDVDNFLDQLFIDCSPTLARLFTGDYFFYLLSQGMTADRAIRSVLKLVRVASFH